jgi:hypothetical protein
MQCKKMVNTTAAKLVLTVMKLDTAVAMTVVTAAKRMLSALGS